MQIHVLDTLPIETIMSATEMTKIGQNSPKGFFFTVYSCKLVKYITVLPEACVLHVWEIFLHIRKIQHFLQEVWFLHISKMVECLQETYFLHM